MNEQQGEIEVHDAKKSSPTFGVGNTSVQVLAPATVANLVCGFDVLGMCLNEPNDLMEIKLLDEKKIIIISADGYPLPLDPAQNTAGAPLVEMINELPGNIGLAPSI